MNQPVFDVWNRGFVIELNWVKNKRHHKRKQSCPEYQKGVYTLSLQLVFKLASNIWLNLQEERQKYKRP